jgi:hypothetical protein
LDKIKDVVVEYLREHPEQRGMDADDLAATALVLAFPCKLHFRVFANPAANQDQMSFRAIPPRRGSFTVSSGNLRSTANA